VLVKSEGKRPLRRPKRRYVDNIKLDLGEIVWDDVDWIGLAQDTSKWRARKCDNEGSGSMKFWETIDWRHNWWLLE
jgi:hypothetical protein